MPGGSEDLRVIISDMRVEVGQLGFDGALDLGSAKDRLSVH